MKLKRSVKIILSVVVILLVAIYLALGPGLRIWINSNVDTISSNVSTRTDDLVHLGGLDGDFFSGFTATNVAVYSDKDINHLPLLTADRIIFTIPIGNILNSTFFPSRVEMHGYQVNVYIDEDGEVALPDLKLSFAPNPPVRHAAMVPGPQLMKFPWACSGGVIEVHKRFTGVSETVNIVFFRSGGYGKYIEDTGIEITSFTAEYFSTPFELSGSIPFDEITPVDLTCSTEPVNLSSVFRNFEPIFHSSPYVPDGSAELTINVKGQKEHLEAFGTFKLTETKFGNAKIDNTWGEVSYSAGVININNFEADTYGGMLSGTATVNLLSETPRWDANCNFQTVDIPAYLEANGFLRYPMTGEFSGSVTAQGSFSDPGDLQISVNLNSSGGKFLSPFCEKLMRPAQLQPSEIQITDDDLAEFSNLATDARIINSEILIDRLRFVSEDLQIEGNGLIGFDKSIVAGGGLSVPLQLAKAHPRFGTFVAFLPDSLNRVALEFSVRGSIAEPEFSANPSENLLMGLADNSSDLMHDIGSSLTDLDGN